MNFYDLYTDALEKVAKHDFDRALKDPRKTGLAHVSAILGEDRRLTPAQVRQLYQKASSDDKPYFAALTAKGIAETYRDNAHISRAARRHHQKAQKKADRKAGSIFNRVLPGGAERKAKHQARSKYHAAQGGKHADNMISAADIGYDHHLDSQKMGEGSTVPGGSKRARQLANDYMKKHFS